MLQGKARGHISCDKKGTSYTLEAHHLAWKELFIPDMTLEGTIESNSHAFCLNVADFAVDNPTFEIFPKLRLQLVGEIKEEMLIGEGKFWGFGQQPFLLSYALPVHYSQHPYDVQIHKETPFSFHIVGAGSIDPLLAFLENASLIARGNIDLDLTATGTWNSPNLMGRVRYEGGSIESLITGALFNEIDMEMEGAGNQLLVRSLQATDLNGGDLTGSGYITWDPEHFFPFRFELSARNYQIITLDPLTAAMNAEILLSGSLRQINIEGRAQLTKGHLAIPSKMPPQVPIIEVVYTNPLPVKDHILPSRPIIPLFWDIEIESAGTLCIEGRGLESTWKGNLHIGGEQNALSVQGKLRLVEGRLKVINQTFGLVEGRVHINGLEPKDLYIDLKGDYELPHLTCSLVLMGTIDNTHLSLCSNPPMNTNQILSWMLFQQDLNELSPMQACRLATILVSLSGRYTGPSTFENIKEGLGIDVFSITDCDIDSADLTFQVGKYLSQGTFVGINKSLSGNYDSVLIQTRLIRDFFLEADYGGSLNGLTSNGGKVILKWYKSY